MIFYLLLCNIIFIPLVFCSNITISKSDMANTTVSDSHHKKLSNESTKVVLLSEGGSILPYALDKPLPKGNYSVPSMGNESVKNKVVARKGVIYSANNITKPQDLLLQSNGTSLKQSITQGDKSLVEKPTTSVITEKTIPQNDIKDSNITKKFNETEKHKKPLILHSDELENMTVKSSSGTSTKDQIPINKDVKTYITNVNKHPGMVMPLVITILLVPMFAVLGYMALRRGQEAWKNRHYKRMDFLLDGMYND